jgi:hypothetical protein
MRNNKQNYRVRTHKQRRGSRARFQASFFFPHVLLDDPLIALWKAASLASMMDDGRLRV